MKSRILTTSCLPFLASMAMGQTIPVSTITYISKVPILVKTGIYSNTVLHGGRLNTLSGNLQISLAPRNSTLPSDLYVKLYKPLPAEDYPKIEFALTDNLHPIPHWQPLNRSGKDQTGFPFEHILAAIHLFYKDSAILQFRYRQSRQIIQRSVFYRPQISPVIEAFRQKEVADSIDNKIKSLTANDAKKKWFSFNPLTGNVLLLSPGKKLDLLIRKNNWSRDSCILYRIYKISDTSKPDWQLTGHLLALSSLASGSRYLLEIRYLDMRLTNTYELNIRPYWYQTTLGSSLLTCLAVALLIAIPYRFYLYRLQRELRKRKRLEDQLTTVQTQLNPHFVFNALSTIEGLVTNQENDRANEYLASFSGIMRDTLKNSREPMIPLSEDLDTLEKYLRVEQLRFEFKWSMEIDPSLDLDGIEFPPMLLQPVVENAIKHGISDHGKNGLLTITIQQQGADLVINVKDNGGQKPKPPEHRQGYGLQLTRDRIERLRELYKTENISFNLRHFPNATLATYYFENWIPAYENSYY